MYLLEGSPVSQADLENAGVSTAKCVIVMKDPRYTRSSFVFVMIGCLCYWRWYYGVGGVVDGER